MNPDETPQEMIGRYYRTINPSQIPDGHCAMCAFNAYLGLREYPLIPAQAPRGDFKPFGDWFYKKYVDNELKVVATVNNGNDTNLKHFEQIVSNAIKEHTHVGEAVLICLDEGDHWYVALNLDLNVVYIDAQQGIGFNSHISVLTPDTQIEIIQIPDKMLDEYYSHKFAGLKKKKRKHKKHTFKKHTFRKHRKSVTK